MRHSTEITLPRTLDAARRARRFTNEACVSWRVPRLAQDAAIIATELVENTLRHTCTAPRLRLTLRRNELTITVTDDDPNQVMLRENARPPGFGLLLVAQTSRQWGCERVPAGGKTVWATLR
ncbi:hypothetical protein GCM10027445_68280 [Amycolatopsis endophytica]|uniref:Anti-sigma regulatory factor (Ser/Thr protein kinase) n=1 Tax=Amycolatopsis endophytica TaxID=860233 RepID=A0A853BBQ2_9PSEU|nr:ATP-binding protein [Amycolatopsis endophytica]NYI92798.1 anti-sigma regulatory factor (Ser/Thr protein kinase) [Amycolatopsis endophytica]